MNYSKSSKSTLSKRRKSTGRLRQSITKLENKKGPDSWSRKASIQFTTIRKSWNEESKNSKEDFKLKVFRGKKKIVSSKK